VKIVVLAVGKLRDRGLRALADDYLARAARHVSIAEIEADDDDALLRRVPAGAEVVALEPGGAAWTTEAFTEFVRDRMVHGARAVVFAIGGADGLPAALVHTAARRLSLSSLTLPHRLARIVLLEQIYRALSIIKGEPYARQQAPRKVPRSGPVRR